MFERFTKEARQVVTKAVEEARSRGDGRIGTVHLLLGVFDSPPAQSPILSQPGLSADLLRQGTRWMVRPCCPSASIRS